jgi:hypothetical protein
MWEKIEEHFHTPALREAFVRTIFAVGALARVAVGDRRRHGDEMHGSAASLAHRGRAGVG